MVAIKKLISYIIPLIVLILFVMFYYNPTGAFESVKNVVSDVNASLDSIIGAEEVTASKPTLPPAQQADVDKLIATMERMKSSDTKFCFDNYGGFSNLGGTTITLTYDPSRKSTFIKVLRGVGGVQEVFFKEVEGMKPCVIAGSEDVVETFNTAFLNTNSWDVKSYFLNNFIDTQHLKKEHFTPVNSIQITYKSGWDVSDGNIIRIPEFGTGTVNDVNNNLIDGGMLYTPDNEHICFFPTIPDPFGPSCDGSDKDGLDDDCLGADLTEDISITRQLKEGKLLSCG
ncbi:hypothetical protein COV17_01425 [Candidatus Woesearchaeota archaeon CG10_big_fil_rev_8_21_14_0_10_36_11]|nr:MAG: hypothetical protein COV17_01425 [Candidatus Woesearchaeota archaeon CG10_big_fil_rev_8_21_14_0_10_36_11]